MKVTGTVVIDLTRIRLDSRDAVSTARATIWTSLSEAPPGADVRLLVPRWDWWCRLVAETFLDLSDDIASVTVESREPVAVRNWVVALRQQVRAAESVMDR